MMILKPSAVRGHASIVGAVLRAAAVFTLAGCGSDSTTPSTPATPVASATPAPTPAPSAVTCNPTPPPLYGIKVTIRDASGYRKIVGAEPLVVNEDGYCGKVGFDPNQFFCTTRTASDPAKRSCDSVAVGVSGDTGRYGPTWIYEGRPCNQPGDQEGCENHPTDQFLAYAKGSGEFAACAAPSIPVNPEGSRCGLIQMP